MEREDNAKTWPLTEGQLGLWMAYQLAPAASVYNVPIAQWVEPSADVDTLRAAFRALVFRHPALSSVVEERGGSMVQRGGIHLEPDWEELSLGAASDDALIGKARELGRIPFDLENGPLLRVRLLRRTSGKSLLLTTVHHIAFDGVSLGILLGDLTEAYFALQSSDSTPWELPDTGYAAFANMQAARARSVASEPDREYWRAQLAVGAPRLELPFARPKTGPAKHGDSEHFELGTKLAQAVRACAAAHRVTASTVLMSAYQGLLARYCQVDRVALAVPMEGRESTEHENTIGYFVNVLPIIQDVPASITLASLLEQDQERIYDALEHGQLPVYSVLREGKGKVSFDAAYYFQSWSGDLSKDGASLPLSAPLLVVQQEGELDLVLEVFEVDNVFRARFKYNPERCAPESIRRLAQHFVHLLDQWLSHPDSPLSSLDLLTPSERATMLDAWNDTSAPLSAGDAVVDRVRRTARRVPSNQAVRFLDQIYSYAELDRRSDRIAAYLRAQGVREGSLVGVLLPRSGEIVEALLGVLKAGAAYVPLDPEYPRDRLQFMLDDAQVEVVLSDTARLGTLLDSLENCRPADLSEAVRVGATDVALPASDLERTAYVIYTSGSTGKPKGVRVSHGNFANFLLAMERDPGLSEQDSVAAVTTLCFDIAGLEIFLPLVSGASVVVAPAEVTRDGLGLASFIDRQKPTVVQATPATWQMLLQAEWKGRVTKILCGGEGLPQPLAEALCARCDALFNMYGPTETTVWSTIKKIEGGDITLGKPIANTAVYVLDGQGQPVPVGVPGELYIAGEGVAQGYLNRPELTSERFVPNPFHPRWRVMYRTGDVVRFRADGQIEFAGRADGQVKIRGHRVELSEVETVLCERVTGVVEAVAVARATSTGHQQLVAFVKWASEPLSFPQLRDQLKAWLPEHMVPSRVLSVSSYPTTQNLKVDRGRLTKASFKELAPHLREEAQVGDVSPSATRPQAKQELTRLVCEAVAELLEVRVDDVDPSATFGSQGLDSIGFTSLAVRLRKRLSLEINPALFYEYPSVLELVSHLSLRGAVSAASASFAVTEPPIPTGTEPTEREAVAIVGVSVRLPGSPDLESFWQNLLAGKDLVSEAPRERWDFTRMEDGEHARWGGFIDDVACFDAGFFGLSPREAEQMDPQQRVMLESVWSALEDAGQTPQELHGTRTGVFIGVSGSDFIGSSGQRPLEGHTLTGLARSILANRISYLLNLQGPSSPVDTACSSSLVALHRAVTAIQHGECTAAIVGGINLILSPFAHLAGAKTGMMSPDGRCKAFDASGNGYVRSEGAVSVFLTPLSVAIREGHHIYATIAASAENHGGRANSLTAPNARAQSEVVASALLRAGWDPSTVGHVEAHGTGTALGDPIEVQGLRRAFENVAKKQNLELGSDPWCTLGSVKTSVGHLEAAAGLAGVIAAMQCVRHGKVPPLVHLQQPNPHLELAGSPFLLADNADREWQANARTGRRRAGVSSFGMGGSNAHVLLEQWIAGPEVAQPSSAYLFVYSARDSDALRRVLARHAQFIAQRERDDAWLRAYAYTLQRGREALRERVAVLARSRDDLLAQLQAALADSTSSATCFFGTAPRRSQTDQEGAAPYDAADPRALERLAAAWVLGGEIPLAAIYPERPVRVSAPSYPFERTLFPCSFSTVAAGERTPASEPAGDACPIRVQARGDNSASIALSGREVFLTDHKVSGMQVVPGVAHLEMVRVVAAELGKRLPAVASDVVWSTPIVANRPLELEVELDDGERGVGFEIRSIGAGGERIIHSRGRFSAISQTPSGAVDLPAIGARCSESQTGAECYAVFDSFDFRYGPAFRVLESVRLAEGEALAVLSLAELCDWPAPEAALALHPVVLDGALQVASIMLGRAAQAEGARYLPFALDSLTLQGALRDARYVHARFTAGGSANVKKLDLDLLSANGELVCALRGFSTRRQKESGIQAVPAVAPCLFAPAWRAAPIEVAPTTVRAPRTILVLLSDPEELGASWPSGDRVMTVTPGPCFARRSASWFDVSPHDPADMRALFDHLASEKMLPDAVVFGWHMFRPGDSSSEALERTAAGLIHLCKSLLQPRSQPLPFLYVGSPGNAALAPLRAALHRAVGGFARSMAREQSQWRVRGVWATSEGQLAGETLRQEIEAAAELPIEVRYRDGEREQRWLTELAVMEKACPPARSDRVYLVTGGAGALGQIVSEDLVQRGARRLAWLTRKPLNEAQQRQRAALEQQGATVMVVEADLGAARAVESAVQRIRAELGPVCGVFHLAGSLDDGLLPSKDARRVQQVMTPKMQGTLHLDQALLEDPLEEFVLFGSTSGVFGNAGQSDYAMANAFLSEFAEQRELLRETGLRRGRTLCIDWAFWADGAMRMPAAAQAQLARDAGIHPMTRTQGMSVLRALLAGEASNVVAFSAESARLQSFLGHAGFLLPSGASTPFQEPDMDLVESSRTEAPAARSVTHHRPELMAWLKELVARATGLSVHQVREGMSFQELGVDSVLTLELNKKLEQHFGPQPATLFFEYPDLPTLADLFLTTHGEAVRRLLGVSESASAVPVNAPSGRVEAKAAGAPAVRRAAEQAKSPSRAEAEDDRIAIIGIAGRYPKSPTLEAFWENLKNGCDCIEEIPAERFSLHATFDPEQKRSGASFSKWGGFLSDVDKFDSLFFNISPFEAQLIDPQERLFLETVWHTMEDAGYTRAGLASSRVGVYVGAMWGHYQLFGNGKMPDGHVTTPTSSYASIANRVSYFFNFRGPSIALDTMCSSSLTALHLACESLRSGETDVAIAGGVNVTVHPNKYVFLSQTGFASSDGRCRSFGEGGDGYVPGEGVGAVLLKPLARALESGDRIYGVIRATSINHGGRGNGYTVPNPNAHAELIRSTLDKAGVDPSAVDYVEAHGTGTSLGDPIEIRGLVRAFGPKTESGSCPIGSVKSNVGHLESAAGIAALTKVLLQMRHEQLVPSLHSDPPNQKIDFASTPFRVQRKLERWERRVVEVDGEMRALPRVAAISSFGAGGANAHLIVEEHIAETSAPSAEREQQLFVLSARSPERLREAALRLRDTVSGPTPQNPAPTPRQRDDLRELVAEVLNVPPEKITMQESLEELGMQAYDMAQLSERLLERYGTSLSEVLSLSSTPRELAAALTLIPASQEGEQRQAPQQKVEPLALSAVAHTLQIGREHMEERLAILAASREELSAALEAFCAGEARPNLFTGGADTSKSRAMALFAGDDGRAFVDGLLARGRLSELAVLFTEGADIDFSRIAQKAPAPRVGLAGYPFARERCWIPAELKKVPVRRFVRPLIDDVDPRASLRHGLVLTGTLRPEEPWLAAWLDPKAPELPASVAIELCAEGMEQLTGGSIVIQSLALHEPLRLAQSQVPFCLRVEAEEGGYRFFLETGEGEAKVCHASMVVREAAGDSLPILSTESLREKSAEWLRGPALAEAFSEAGVSIGAGVGLLEELALRDHEAFAQYVLPDGQQHELEDFSSHPGIWQLALSQCALLASRRLGAPQEVRHVEQLEVFGAPSRLGATYAQLTQEGSANVLLLDREGHPLGRAQGVELGLARDALRRFFYLPTFRPAQTRPQRELRGGVTTVVYDAEQRLLAEALCAELGSDVSCVELPEDEAARFVALEANLDNLCAADHVYWLCGAELGSSDLHHLDQVRALQCRVLETFLAFVLKLDERGVATDPRNLTIVTNRALAVQSEARPMGAALSGFCRTLAREYPKTRVALIDLDLEVAASGRTLANAARDICAETPSHTPHEIAVRGGLRLERVLYPLELPAPAASTLRERGVYVILGGLGNVGYKLAEHLARRVGARLVISGRRAVDPSIEGKLQTLRDLGADVRYMPADIADLDQLRNLVAFTKSTFGAVHGVFHSAMSFDATRIRQLDTESLRSHLAAKVQGSICVFEAVKHESLDMLVYFSSGESFTGNVGWGSYAAGSLFLDGFAEHAQTQAAFPVQTINWGFWDGDIGEFGAVLRERGIRPIEAGDGMQALERILAARVPQVMALDVRPAIAERMGVEFSRLLSLRAGSHSDHPPATKASFEKLLRVRDGATLRDSGAKRERPQVAASAPAPAAKQVEAGPAERKGKAQPSASDLAGGARELVTTLFASALKLKASDVKPDRSFSDYGADSLVIAEVHKAFEQSLGKLPATFLLENDSVQRATDFLLQEHRDALLSVLGKSSNARAAGSVEDAFAASTTIARPSVVQESADVREAVVPNERKPVARITKAALAELALVPQHQVEAYLGAYGGRFRDGSLAKSLERADFAAGARAPLPRPDAMSHVVVRHADGQHVEAFLAGRGTPILMVPPIGLTAPVWHRQIAAWAGQHRIIVLHHPGYGLSDAQKSFANEAVVELFGRTLDVLGIDEPLHVMGSCFGGLAAQGFAATFRERVASLTLVGSFYRNFGLPDMPVDALTIEQMMDATKAVSESIGRDFDLVSASGAEGLDLALLAAEKQLLLDSQCAKPVHVMRYIAEILRYEGLNILEQIEAPALCVVGTLDTIVAPQTSVFMAETLRRGDLSTVVGSGHYPYMTHNEVFNSQVSAFIRQAEQQNGGLGRTVGAGVI